MEFQFTDLQRSIAEKVRSRYFDLKESNQSRDRERHLSLLTATGALAHALFADLRHQGYSIQFSPAMISNRGTTPDGPEFFCNLPAIEDLFRFLLPIFETTNES